MDNDQDLKQKINSGTLLDDHIVNEIMVKYLNQITKGFILDGFPRTVPQAEYLEGTRHEVDCVLHLMLPDDIIAEKSLGRRICSNITCKCEYNLANLIDEERGIEMPSFAPKNDDKCDKCGSLLSKRDDCENMA